MAIELTEQLLALIDGYLKDTLSISEKEAFEKRLQDEPEFQEEVRLQQQLFDILGKEEWHTIQQSDHTERLAELKSKLRSKEYQDLSASIRNAESAYLEEETKVSPLQKYYRYIAIAAVIIIFFGIYFTQMSSSYYSYYEKYINWSNLPSFVEKGSKQTAFSQGEAAFNQNNFQEAISFFQKVSPADELYNNSLVYIGASYDLLNDNENAIKTFQKIANLEDVYERSRGNWYIALIYLKMENKDKAVTILRELVKDVDNYKYDEAKTLLGKLE